MSEALILVVEDESLVAMHLQRALRKCGYETACARSPEAALRMAAEKRPDLVLMDIMLGGEMDGIELAERLRAEQAAPVVYLTAYTDKATLSRARHTQPMGYLSKPFREADLQSTVEMALFRAAAERRLIEKEQLADVLLESLRDGIVRTDREGRVTIVNTAATQLLGESPQACIGARLDALFRKCGEKTAGAVAAAVATAIGERRQTEVARVRLRPDSDATHTITIGPACDRHGQAGGLIAIIAAASGDTKGEEPPAHRALAEAMNGNRSAGPLTDLPTRAEAERAIAAAFEQEVRLFVGVLVLERFQCLVERFGAAAADELLQFFSVHLGQDLSASDRLYRWTGPSFVVLSVDESYTIIDARREIARLASVRLESFVRVRSHNALVSLSARHTVVMATDLNSAEEAIRRIDAFAKETPAIPVR